MSRSEHDRVRIDRAAPAGSLSREEMMAMSIEDLERRSRSLDAVVTGIQSTDDALEASEVERYNRLLRESNLANDVLREMKVRQG